MNQVKIEMIGAEDTARRLGVKRDTLYAYVSRGLLASVAMPGSRKRYYRAEDVERLRAQRGRSRGGRSADSEVLAPLIASSICLIEDGRLYYRGFDAIHLSDTGTLEDVATLLWHQERSPEPLAHPEPLPAGEMAVPPAFVAEARRLGLIERCQIRLAGLAAADFAALDLSQAGVARTGRRILVELAACVGEDAPAERPVHRQLAEAWRLDPTGADVVRRCLVLLADHELNASTFVARVIASTGATPYAVVSGALGALSGRRHGGASARAEAMFREIAVDPDPMAALAARLARGEQIPGLGQPLYPKGDPRALAIVEAIVGARPEVGRRIAAAAVAATRLTGQYPNVDFALGAAATALGLPPGGALAMFLVARSVGWIAHAIEQYRSGLLIRPRARYTGPPREAHSFSADGQ